ncbi:MAG: NADH-quinone oxidoreductase subunit H [Deltaproteobacteria bacterium]|nr:NADH-quinone oxidoreductase subunit H [Deltaproteobacteria bacterium]MBN2673545.1 NADH-quinone oxidoreductase subunit H [Deltaproteobacteria bacterium]
MKPFDAITLFSALLFSPLLFGIINRIKAMFAGRNGSPLLQTYFDIFKLFRKNMIYGNSTTLVFQLAPAGILAALIVALLLIPWGPIEAPISFSGDFILLAYLLGLSRFLTVIAALDTGSSFEGMGASREVTFAALGEPTFMLGALLLAIHTGESSLSRIFGSIQLTELHPTGTTITLLVAAWMILLLTENSRIPVDDPNTHLELTMIHEVMVLDTGGPLLGIVTYASAIKIWIFSALISNLVFPHLFEKPAMQTVGVAVGIIFVAVVVGIIESIMGRIRLRNIPKLLVGATALVATGLLMTLAG